VFVRPSAAIVVIEGRVGPDSKGGFTTELRVTDPDGEVYGSRELNVPSTDCHKLDELVALIVSITLRHQAGALGIALPEPVAMQLDALFAGEPTDFAASELAPTLAVAPSDPEPESRVRAAAPTADEGPRTLWLRGEAGLRVVKGLQPRATLAPLLGLRLQRRDLGSLALAGSVGLPQEQPAADGAQGTLRYQPWQLALQACLAALQLGAAELGLCADARLGLIQVTARDFIGSNPGSRELWFELAASARVAVKLVGPIYAQGTLGLPWRVTHPVFQYLDSRGHRHQALAMARFGVDLQLGLGVDF
jgi:hypothetical protein